MPRIPQCQLDIINDAVERAQNARRHINFELLLKLRRQVLFTYKKQGLERAKDSALDNFAVSHFRESYREVLDQIFANFLDKKGSDMPASLEVVKVQDGTVEFCYDHRIDVAFRLSPRGQLQKVSCFAHSGTEFIPQTPYQNMTRQAYAILRERGRRDAKTG